MEFTHRTFLRHAAVFVALALFPAVVMDYVSTVLWYRQHAEFFAALLFFGGGIGIAAHYAVVRGFPAAWISGSPARASISSHRLKDMSYARRLLYTWAACSRCVGYWTAACAGGGLSLALWPLVGHSPWAIALRTMYFAVMAGSLASTVAVAIYLFFDRSEPT